MLLYCMVISGCTWYSLAVTIQCYLHNEPIKIIYMYAWSLWINHVNIITTTIRARECYEFYIKKIPRRLKYRTAKWHSSETISTKVIKKGCVKNYEPGSKRKADYQHEGAATFQLHILPCLTVNHPEAFLVCAYVVITLYRLNGWTGIMIIKEQGKYGTRKLIKQGKYVPNYTWLSQFHV